MKKLLLLSVLLIILLTSCQVTERFTLDDDGSALNEMEINLSAIMEMRQSQTEDIKHIDTVVDANADDLESIVATDSETKEQTNDFEKLRKHMHKSKIHLVQNDEELIMTIITETESLNELNTYHEKLNKAQKDIESSESNNTDYLLFGTYEYDGSTFKRKLQGSMAQEPGTEAAESQNKAAELLVYHLEYQLPKPITNASLKNTAIDGNTMTFTDKLSNILQNEDQFRNLTLDF